VWSKGQIRCKFTSVLCPKEQGEGLRIVQDCRALKAHSHIDKYSMKENTECIGDIGRANSTIFSTLTHFWLLTNETR